MLIMMVMLAMMMMKKRTRPWHCEGAPYDLDHDDADDDKDDEEKDLGSVKVPMM